MAQKFYVNAEGVFVGSLIDTEIADAGPEYADAIEIPESPEHASQIWDFGGKAFSPPPPPAYSLEKAVIWERLTDPEAEDITAAMATQSAKMRGRWDSAMTIESNGTFFPDLKAFLIGVVGATRADQLLAP